VLPLKDVGVQWTGNAGPAPAPTLIELPDDHDSSEEGMSETEQNGSQQNVAMGSEGMDRSPEQPDFSHVGTQATHQGSAAATAVPSPMIAQGGVLAAELAEALVLKGTLQSRALSRRAALADFDQAASLLHRATESSATPSPLSIQNSLVQLHLATARTLYDLGRLDEAETRLNQSLAILEGPNGAALSDLPQWRKHRAETLVLRARLQSESHPEAAAEDFRAAISIYADLAADLGDECGPALRLRWSEAEIALAQLYLDLNQTAAALQSVTAAQTALALDRLEPDSRALPDWRMQELLIDLRRCQIELRQGMARSALDALRQMAGRLEQLQESGGEQAQDVCLVELRADYAVAVAQATDLLGHSGESQTVLGDALSTLDDLQRRHGEDVGPWLRRSLARIYYRRAIVEFGRNQLQAAQEACSRGLAALEDLARNDAFARLTGLLRDLAESHILLAKIHAARGAHELAMESLNRALVLQQ